MLVNTALGLKLIKLILKVLIELVKDGVNQLELNKVKNLNLTGMMIHFQKQISYFSYFTDRIANDYKVETLDDIVDKFNNIDINNMNNVINKVINPKQMFISIVGNKEPNKQKIKQLINWFYKQLK